MSDRVNTIDLETAQRWAKKWKKEEGTYNAHCEVHAFTIPLEDITQLMEENIDGIRAYIGVDDNDEEKLMIVGTKYNVETGIFEDMLPSGSTYTGLIYDFTRPCPPTCDPKSALMIK